jgi:hypothetical protein
MPVLYEMHQQGKTTLTHCPSIIPPFSLATCREETRQNLYHAKSKASKKALRFGWRQIVRKCEQILTKHRLSTEYPTTGEEFHSWSEEAAKEVLHHFWHSTKNDHTVKITSYRKVTRTLTWISREKHARRETPWDVNAQFKGYQVTPEWQTKADNAEVKRVPPAQHISRDEMVRALGPESVKPLPIGESNDSVFVAGRLAAYIMTTKGPRSCNIRDVNQAGKDHIDWDRKKTNAVITQSDLRRRKHPNAQSNNEEIFVGCWCPDNKHVWLPDETSDPPFITAEQNFYGHAGNTLWPRAWLICPLRCLELLAKTGSTNSLFHTFTKGAWTAVTDPQRLACNYYNYRGIPRTLQPQMFRKGLAMTC